MVSWKETLPIASDVTLDKWLSSPEPQFPSQVKMELIIPLARPTVTICEGTLLRTPEAQ